ncbi:uncharacterized protein LOC133181292 [Saccostrea echinata]|uniref:uncharacterized protein LOC133181292 n=1 Tax=Saccostrea echinata TaxID=191078 RepID=UPI002A7EAC3C|nr:uncharacterized protein LOC133181292 [Saccostrea echinata]
MVDIKSSSWTCKVEGGLSPVFDDFFLYMTTPSPEEVLTRGERSFGIPGDKNKDGATDEVDGGLFSCFPSFSKEDSSSSSSSSDAEEREAETLRVRRSHSGRLRSFWSRNYLFRLESAYNPMDREDVYHVVKDVQDVAEKELRINDRLVAINEENTKNKSLTDVEIMWEQLQRCPKIQLKVWRWLFGENGLQICEITIVFYSIQPEELYKELSSLSLGGKIPRRVKNLRWTSSKFRPFHLRIACKTGIYVSAHVEDMALYGEPISQKPQQSRFRFMIRFFECMVTNNDGTSDQRFGYVAKYKENGKYFDISSIITESASTVVLKPHVSYSSMAPDERFLIMYEVEDDDDVFESLLYENMFMKFNNETKKITMQERQALGPFFLFQTFVARGNKPPQVNINCFSDGGRLFAFEPITEENCDP